MNTEQLKLLRDYAKSADSDKTWSSLSKFLSLVNPQDIMTICDELLLLRAGNSKTPSIRPSKQALEQLLQAEVLVPSYDKIKNGYAIRYAGFSFDATKEGPTEGVLWTAQEKYIYELRQQGRLISFIQQLEHQAAIPTWHLTVEVGKRKNYEGTLIFRYIREDHAKIQQLSFFP
ncbi:hypothetical protein [Pelistega ratti]|uniref:hypothetical protein n=1 Tax=Pelistega ratti TaxID=2652177 RepID=UPI0013580EA2|nr:hypothetical protein [Pelistega ratti]